MIAKAAKLLRILRAADWRVALRRWLSTQCMLPLSPLKKSHASR